MNMGALLRRRARHFIRVGADENSVDGVTQLQKHMIEQAARKVTPRLIRQRRFQPRLAEVERLGRNQRPEAHRKDPANCSTSRASRSRSSRDFMIVSVAKQRTFSISSPRSTTIA